MILRLHDMGTVCINVSDFKIFRYSNQYRSLVTGTFPENQQICVTTQTQTTTTPRHVDLKWEKISLKQIPVRAVVLQAHGK